MNTVSVVIPVHKEKVSVVENLYYDLLELGYEVIVVDDGSTMKLSIPHVATFRHRGYGGAIKEGIRRATRPYILTMDGDGEHRVDDVVKLDKTFHLITLCDMLVGCRWNKKESALRWIGRKGINFIAALWCRHFLVDLNSGMRIFRRELALGYESILCDTFSFTTSLTMCMVTDNHKVAWFPIDTNPRVYGKSHVKLFRDTLITLKYIFWIGFALRTRKMRAWLRSAIHTRST